VQPTEDECSVVVAHELENAEFIQAQIKSGRAHYGCLIAVSVTGHRELKLSSDLNQSVSWESGIAGEPPSIRPIIVATESFQHKFEKGDGVADLWVGKNISIPMGAGLARDDFQRTKSTMLSLMSIQEREKLPDGSFVVESDSTGGYQFNVYVASDLFHFFAKYGPWWLLRENIGVHMMTSCLWILRKEFKYHSGEEEDDSWKNFANLQMLDRDLASRDLGNWTDENFDPESVAMCLKPLRFPALDDLEE